MNEAEAPVVLRVIEEWAPERLREVARALRGLRHDIRRGRFTQHMIDGDRAREIEERFTELLDVEVRELRDYLRGNIGESANRRTGFRFIRGTHGGQYVRDPEGTDIPPVRVSVPG
jgi:hypothetical protein